MLSPTFFRHILLADDDSDDRSLFEDALLQVDGAAQLTLAENGKKLMDLLLLPPDPIPDLVFLDLNMPLKNGYECLAEIRSLESPLRQLRVIVLSTSQDWRNVDQVYELGASYYAVKPNNFSSLKSLIQKALSMDWTGVTQRPDKESFMLSA